MYIYTTIYHFKTKCETSQSCLLLVSLPLVVDTDPVSAQPPLIRPFTISCTVQIIDLTNCSTWDQIVSQPIQVPSVDECAPPYSKIILDVAATEQGTQFDRYGALWLGDVEVLRTTTPEPTSQGTQWSIEKDVSIYGD